MQTIETDQSQRSFSDRFVIVIFAVVVLSLTVATWARYLHLPQDKTYPLMWRWDSFSDLLDYRGKMLHLERGASFVGSGLPVFNYLAPAAFLYHWLLGSNDPTFWFLTVVVGGFGMLLLGAGWMLWRNKLLQTEDVLALVAMGVSFPFTFLVHRANLEGFVWLAVTASLLLLLRQRYICAAVLLALAMSIKPFPAVLLPLFLVRRRYLAVLVSVGITAALVIWGLAELGPDVLGAYRGLHFGVALYTRGYLQSFRTPLEQQFAHGLIDVERALYLKYLWLFRGISPDSLVDKPTPRFFVPVYAGAALLIVTGMLWKLRNMPAINQVVGCGLALTMLPPSAADYTLCSLYLPTLLIGYFLVTEVRSHRVRWGLPHMILLLLPATMLLSPLNMFGLWTGPVRFLLLLMFSAGALVLPLRTPTLDQVNQIAFNS